MPEPVRCIACELEGLGYNDYMLGCALHVRRFALENGVDWLVYLRDLMDMVIKEKETLTQQAEHA